jgi:hypothetical protein
MQPWCNFVAALVVEITHLSANRVRVGEHLDHAYHAGGCAIRSMGGEIRGLFARPDKALMGSYPYPRQDTSAQRNSAPVYPSY